VATGYGAPCGPAAHRHLLQRLPITTQPRTVADLARQLAREPGVVMADAALRAGVDRAAVMTILDDCARWPGAARAVATLALADRRAQSPLESLVRLWFADTGLPQPDLQTAFCDPLNGSFIARDDFSWCSTGRCARWTVERSTTRLTARCGVRGGGDALWREKVREDALRDVGLEVARGYWSDRVDGGAALAERVRRAFSRAALRADAPRYGVLRPR
jgi:hypothetical protein